MDDEYPSTHTSSWLLSPAAVWLEPVPPPEEVPLLVVVPLLLEELRALVLPGGPSLVEPDEPELPEDPELFPVGGLELLPLEPWVDPLPPPLDWDVEEPDVDVDVEFPCPLEWA